MLKKSCIDDFLIFINIDTNIYSEIRGQSY